MKLYAVSLLARPEIDGRIYPFRWMPISKVAHIPKARRGGLPDNIEYAPAVYTNRKAADKMLKIMRRNFPANNYQIIDFDSNAVEIPQ